MKIDHTLINPDTLDNLLGEFILREATDYGAVEQSFAQKKERLFKQLNTGKVCVVYDLTTESCNIIPAAETPL